MGKMLICSQCGFTWDEFLARKRLGCTHCYQVFEKELNFFLTEFRGKTPHPVLPVPALQIGNHPLKMSFVGPLVTLRSLVVQPDLFATTAAV